MRGRQPITATNSDPRGTGVATVQVNSDWDAGGEGPVWGTFVLALDAGGAWEGSFSGIRSQVTGGWLTENKIVGCGVAGDVDGMQIRGTEQFISYQLRPIFFWNAAATSAKNSSSSVMAQFSAAPVE